MSDIAIKVEKLSKIYRLGLKEEMHDTLISAMLSCIKAPIDNFRQLRKLTAFSEKDSDEDTIWALKDVSFEVKQGEVLGIIGRNGAGKSTLLKILSKITEPTSGRAIINGRVGSLLEVGTGFHPELTGRENIYLNGTILGMKKHEIDRKFDEIVEFAEIAKFIDTPVKRYSSGMRVRLAFSVAAHLEPEILLVDEVLAVGDAEFQKKCLGKMGDVAGHGRTVLFVSHNMTAVQTICQRGMYLRQGKLQFTGNMVDVVKTYLSEDFSSNQKIVWAIDNAPGNKYVKLISAEVKSVTGQDIIYSGDSFIFKLIFINMHKHNFEIDVTYHLVDEMGATVFVASTANYVGYSISDKGIHHVSCFIPSNLMQEGYYTISKLIFIKNKGTSLFGFRNLLSFEIISKKKEHLGWMAKKEGVVRPKLKWSVEKIN